MKALSIAQPWAGMIMDGHKDIETRSWRPKKDKLPYRIAIVSCIQPSGIKPDFEGIGFLNEKYYSAPGLMVRGGILGSVLLVDVKQYNDINTWRTDRKRHRAPDTYFPGKYGWVFEDPRPLVRPRPYKGKLSLYEIPDKELDF